MNMRKTNVIKFLLGFLVVAVISLLLLQCLDMRAHQKRVAVLQDRLAAEQKKIDELRMRLEAVREELERLQRFRQKNEQQGDYWLPGEFDRLRKIKPALEPGA
jgi:septal ring factor EnvC (AmiA/AmiB activator)